MDEQEDENANPWPSFVDCFSIVICVFIFAIIIAIVNNLIITFDSSLKKRVEREAIVDEVPSGTASQETTRVFPDKSKEENTQDEGTHNKQGGELASNKEAVNAQTKDEAELSAADKSKEDNTQSEGTHNKQGGELISNKEAVNAQTKGEAELSGVDEGLFDVIQEDNIKIIENENKITISYQGTPGIISEKKSAQIITWIGKTGKKRFNVDVHISQRALPFSDALRLGYEQGIFLLKDVKRHDKDIYMNIQVSVEADLSENKTVIYPEE